MLELYSYWRSSAAYRVRLTLNLKELNYALVPVNLAGSAPAHRQPEYLSLNPDALVPTLVHDGRAIGQSMAIAEYLESQFPTPPLLPSNPVAAAEVRGFCQAIACDIHPLNNLRVLNYLKGPLALDTDQVTTWYREWIARGFEALERRLSGRDTAFAYGDSPGLAECFLVPQMYNARRFDTPLDPYPRLVAIDRRCADLEAFVRAHPDQQPDAPR